MNTIIAGVNANDKPTPVRVDGSGNIRAIPPTANNYTETEIFDLTAQTATKTGPWINNTKYESVLLYFDITTVPTTDTVRFSIQTRGKARATVSNLLLGDLEVATGVFTYYIGLGAVVGDGGLDKVLGTALPFEFRFVITHSSTGEFDYSLDALYHHSGWRF